jgi:hypothetical protein
MGVSLQMPSIVIDGPAVGAPGDEIALDRDDSSSRENCYSNSDATEIDEGLSYDEPIRILTAWLEEQDWTVKWYTSGDHVDAASLLDKLVTVSKRQIPRHQYYSLLHEAAHVDLLTGPLETRTGEPNGYLDLWHGQVDERTLRHRAAVVIDEIQTWEHGTKLAAILGLGIDPVKYRDFRNRNLKSYFAWALEREASE